MPNLLISPRAEQDLQEIYYHTFINWGFVQAEKYQDQLFDGMNHILEYREIRKAYLHTKIKYRKFHINRHLIFYRFEKEDCIIIRLLHDRMNLREHL